MSLGVAAPVAGRGPAAGSGLAVGFIGVAVVKHTGVGAHQHPSLLVAGYTVAVGIPRHDDRGAAAVVFAPVDDLIRLENLIASPSIIAVALFPDRDADKVAPKGLKRDGIGLGLYALPFEVFGKAQVVVVLFSDRNGLCAKGRRAVAALVYRLKAPYDAPVPAVRAIALGGKFHEGGATVVAYLRHPEEAGQGGAVACTKCGRGIKAIHYGVGRWHTGRREFVLDKYPTAGKVRIARGIGRAQLYLDIAPDIATIEGSLSPPRGVRGAIRGPCYWLPADLECSHTTVVPTAPVYVLYLHHCFAERVQRDIGPVFGNCNRADLVFYPHEARCARFVLTSIPHFVHDSMPSGREPRHDPGSRPVRGTGEQYGCYRAWFTTQRQRPGDTVAPYFCRPLVLRAAGHDLWGRDFQNCQAVERGDGHAERRFTRRTRHYGSSDVTYRDDLVQGIRFSTGPVYDRPAALNLVALCTELVAVIAIRCGKTTCSPRAEESSVPKIVLQVWITAFRRRDIPCGIRLEAALLLTSGIQVHLRMHAHCRQCRPYHQDTLNRFPEITCPVFPGKGALNHQGVALVVVRDVVPKTDQRIRQRAAAIPEDGLPGVPKALRGIQDTRHPPAKAVQGNICRDQDLGRCFVLGPYFARAGGEIRTGRWVPGIHHKTE